MTPLDDMDLHETKYVQALEDALNAYDAAFLTLGLCHKLDKGSMSLYEETRTEHHDALARAITNCLSRGKTEA